jgi:hypothetical protein
VACVRPSEWQSVYGMHEGGGDYPSRGIQQHRRGPGGVSYWSYPFHTLQNKYAEISENCRLKHAFGCEWYSKYDLNAESSRYWKTCLKDGYSTADSIRRETEVACLSRCRISVMQKSDTHTAGNRALSAWIVVRNKSSLLTESWRALKGVAQDQFGNMNGNYCIQSNRNRYLKEKVLQPTYKYNLIIRGSPVLVRT